MKRGLLVVLSVLALGSLSVGVYFAAAAPSSPPQPLHMATLQPRELMPVLAGEASSKDETVFAILAGDGAVERIYVVNTFRQAANAVVDFGEYATLTNLSSETAPTVLEDRISFVVGEEEQVFRFQGELSGRELPWVFAVKYRLNGLEVRAQDLGGATGELELVLEVKQNARAAAQFRENYLVQVSVPLSLENTTSVVAPNATKFVAGQVMTLGYTVLPGESGTFVINAKIEAFTMGAIEIVAMPANMSLGQFGAEMEEGFAKLSAGTAELIAGTIRLREGLRALARGTGQLAAASEQIHGYGPALSQGLESYAGGLTQFAAGMSELAVGSARLQVGLASLGDGAQGLVVGYEHVAGGLQALLSNAPEMEMLASNLRQHEEPAVRMLAEALLGQVGALRQLQGGLGQSNQGLQAYAAGVAALAEQSSQFDQGVQQSAGGAQGLVGGFAELQAGTSGLLVGVEGLNTGLNALAAQTAALPAGVDQLVAGQEELLGGLNSAKEAIAAVDRAGDNDTLLSFVAPGRARAESVQFVLRTATIEKPVMPPVTALPAQEPTFWQRLSALFSWLNGIWRG